MVATARGARLHPAWVAAAVAFVALLCAAGFRAAPGVLMVPLQEEFGWSRSVVSLAVGVNLVLFLPSPSASPGSSWSTRWTYFHQLGQRSVWRISSHTWSMGACRRQLLTKW